jgi:hypothetical protein
VKTIRVLSDGGKNGWLTRPGDRVSIEVPGGRVTLKFVATSQSGIVYTQLTYEDIRKGLVRFNREGRVA